MSTVVRFKNIRLEVLTDDHTPAHTHAVGPDAEAKIEIETGRVIWSYGFTSKMLSEIQAKVAEFREELMEKWNEYHE